MSSDRVIKKLNKKSVHPNKIKRNILSYFCFILISISISFIICFLVLNLIIRISDIYAYTLKNNKVMSNISGDISEDDVANKIASYFQNRENKPSLTLYYNGNFENVFSNTTIKVLKGYRDLLNKSLIVIIVMFAVLILSLIYLFYQRFWKIIRNGLVFSGALLLGFFIFFAVNTLNNSGFSKLSIALTGTELNKEEIFSIIIGKDFFITLFIVFIIITVALFALLTYTLNYIKKYFNLGK